MMKNTIVNQIWNQIWDNTDRIDVLEHFHKATAEDIAYADGYHDALLQLLYNLHEIPEEEYELRRQYPKNADI